MSSSKNATIDINVWRTAPYLIAEFWKQFAAMLSAVLIWGLAITAGQVFGDALSLKDILGFFLYGFYVALLVLLGHIVPTYLAGRLAWGWSVLATSVLWTGATIIMGSMASDEYREAYSGTGMVVIGALILIIPTLGLTALIRGIVRPLRPTRTLPAESLT